MIAMKRLLPLMMVMACGGGNSADPDANESDARLATMDGACPFEERVGLFEVKHLTNLSLAGGHVLDGVVPADIPILEYEEAGCQYLRKVFPFCDPPCQPTQTCDQNNTCIDAPLQQNAGTVTVDGLVADVSMQPNQFNDYEDSSLASPPFAPGAAITLSASGDVVPPFVLDGVGVAPMAIADDTWTMTAGQPMTIEWTPADGPGRIYISLNVDLHGNSPVTMFCDVEDTGSTTIPATMVDRLIDFGITVGFASATIARRTVDHIDSTDGCVEFRVLSQLDPSFALE